MKNSKKSFALFVVAAGALCALAGCGSTTTSDEVTINFITNRTDLDSDGTYTKYIAAFNKEAGCEKITVKVESIKDYEGTMKKRMLTKNYGDILMIPEVDADSYSKYFVDLGSAKSFIDTNKYNNAYLYKRAYLNEVYGLPYMNNVTGVAYNKKVFSDAGVDASKIATPAEFLTAMQTIKDSTTGLAKDAIPYYTNFKDGWCSNQWEDDFQAGLLTGDADYNNNQLPFDKNVWKKDSNDTHYEGTKLFFDLVAKDLVESDPNATDWETSKLKIAQGKIGCMVMGNWCISQFQDLATTNNLDPSNIGYMPFPMTATDGKRYAASGSDYCYGINVNSSADKIAASKKFMTFMIEKSGLAVAQGGISLMKADPLPTTLSAFSSVNYLVANPATKANATALADVQTASGITLYDSGTRFGKVLAAAQTTGDYNTKLAAFDVVMAKYNSDWAKAIK
jgi:raffinose/stachyose/melibiose transport system substrate-binding protein